MTSLPLALVRSSLGTEKLRCSRGREQLKWEIGEVRVDCLGAISSRQRKAATSLRKYQVACYHFLIMPYHVPSNGHILRNRQSYIERTVGIRITIDGWPPVTNCNALFMPILSSRSAAQMDGFVYNHFFSAEPRDCWTLQGARALLLPSTILPLSRHRGINIPALS